MGRQGVDFEPMNVSTPATTTPAVEAPKTTWDKVIVSTPVVMTVVATILAGLSSSEMNQAQYYRSVAAQQQSKASDQWSLFQAKRQRGLSASQAAHLLTALGDVEPFSLDALKKLSPPPSRPGWTICKALRARLLNRSFRRSTPTSAIPGSRRHTRP